MTSLADAMSRGPVVLDGGLATYLECSGHDLGTRLWSARLLVEDPAAIRDAHRAYFQAGARVAISSSYQASFEGLAAIGVDEAEAAALLVRSVRLASEARDSVDDGTTRWVAVSVGPYGAALADGSEYRGDYGLGVGELRRWHRRRLEVLADAGADVVALETVPCLREAEALLAEVERLQCDSWLSLTCDGLQTRAGEPAADAFAMARGLDNVIAVGVNCTEPQYVADLVAAAREASGGKPVVAYPNSGERWDAARRRWTGSAYFAPADVARWARAGASLVGGCCRVGPRQISQLATALDR